MQTQTKTYESRVVRKGIELWIPHKAGEIAFAYPSVGPRNYRAVGKQILDARQQVPTGDYLASLLHSTYCDEKVTNEPEFQDVRKLMRTQWLWVFNRNLWTEDGVYIIQDEDAVGRSQPLVENELEEKINGGTEVRGVKFSRDRKIRFAPKEIYRLGEHTPKSLAKDGFIIASFDEEGAEKLGEFSAKFRNQPFVYGIEIEEGQAPEQRVSAVYGCYGGGFGFVGYGLVGGWYGRAFGVLK